MSWWMQPDSIHEVRLSTTRGIILKVSFALPVALAYQKSSCLLKEFRE